MNSKQISPELRSTTSPVVAHVHSGHQDASARSPEDDYAAPSSSSSPASETGSFGTESRPQSACDSTKASQSESATDAPETPDSSRASPTQSAKVVSAGGKEKRKRSRVTAEQLVQLERIFASDRSPTAARRKEISDMLGMHERQTQIWFQNRRAKAKLHEEKMKSRGNLPDSPPDTPPALSQGFDSSLYNLIHEDDHVSIIPCSDLAIGTWRRIASALSKHDLVAYVCETKHCLTWYINSSGYGFKMVIPFDIIINTKFSNIGPGTGVASFTLSQPPQFYMESFVPSQTGEPPMRIWKRCADWTEGTQATQVLRHDLAGPAIQLAQFIQTLNQGGGVGILLRSPADHLELTSTAEAVPTGLAVTMADEYRHEEQLRQTSLAQQLDNALRQRSSPQFAGLRPSSMVTGHMNRSSSASSYPLGHLPTVDGFGARHPVMPQTAIASAPLYNSQFDPSRSFAQRNVSSEYFRLMPTSRPSTQGSTISQGSDSYVSTPSTGSTTSLDYMQGPLSTMSTPLSHSPYGTPSPSALDTQYTQSSWGEGSIPRTPSGTAMFQQHHQVGQTSSGSLPSLAYPPTSDAVSYFQGHTLNL